MITRRAAGLALVSLVCAGTAALGAWQISRGHWRERAQAQAAADPVVEIRGTYLADRQLLLDGQGHDGKPGLHVWTPIAIAGEPLLIVDRGWIALDANDLTPPAGEIVISGKRRALPQPAIRLASAPPQCPAKDFPLRVQYPTAADLRCVLGAEVQDGLLQLSPEAPGGYVRVWGEHTFPPERHYAYAAQWFGLSAVAAVALFRMFRSR